MTKLIGMINSFQNVQPRNVADYSVVLNSTDIFLFYNALNAYDAKHIRYRKPCRHETSKLRVHSAVVMIHGLYLFYNNRSRQTAFIKLWSGIDSNIPYYTTLLLISRNASIQSISNKNSAIPKDMHKFHSSVCTL